jgi:flagellar biosynthetic protein FliS
MTAVEGASGFGLLIALFDTLAGNLRRAAAAQRANDIEGRCREAKHALTIIGYLESCLHSCEVGQLTRQLRAFYASLRHKLLEAQAEQSAEAFEKEMANVLKIREYWQQIEQPSATPVPMDMRTVTTMQPGGYAPAQAERRYGDWSA